MFRKLLGCMVGAGILIGAAGTANAMLMDFSFTGTFAQDDNVQLFNFTADGASTITLRSYGYAGGTNAAGNVISAGGFDPILSLFDSTGLLIDYQDDAGDDGNVVPADPVTGRRFDVLLSVMLSAGAYTVSISEYANFALGPNLTNGFSRQGDGNFTGTDCGVMGGSFLDTGFGDCSQRTNEWAFDILNVESAVIVTVPEPGSLTLFAVGLLGLGVIARRRKVA